MALHERLIKPKQEKTQCDDPQKFSVSECQNR